MRTFTGGEGRAKAGRRQVGMAVTASTLTTVAVFIPMLFVPGMTGQIFRDLSLTIAAALFISLFVSQSLIPVLASRSKNLIKPHSERSLSTKIQRWLEKLEDKYARAIGWLTEHSKSVFIPVILIFAVSFFVMSFIPKTFLPEPKEGIIDIDVSLAPGTGLEFTDSMLVGIEGRILEIIEPGDLDNSYLSVGKQEGMGALFGSSSSSNGELNLYFVRESERSRSIEYYDQVIRDLLDTVPGIEYSLTSGMPIGNELPVTIVIYGTDLDDLRRIGELVKSEMCLIPGTVDISSTMENQIMQIDFVLDENVLFLRGQSPVAIGSEVTVGFLGLDATTCTENNQEFDVYLRYAEEARSSREAMAGIIAYGMPLMPGAVFITPWLPKR